ncbi:MAG: hypothetical protein LKE29_05375 [Acidaminococcaceae bacterium]|jgi:hypothetical protein|nr:hypothetical protein [Acidaminococcaceae bacterium]
MEKSLPAAFIGHASEILGDTNMGLTGAEIVRHSNEYANTFEVDIPITDSNFGRFGSIVPNKRTALKKNLEAFNGQQQFTIIKELCELPAFRNNDNVQRLKQQLVSKYQEFSGGQIFLDMFEETGWKIIDKSLLIMQMNLACANTVVELNAVGLIGRQTIIQIARQVYNPAIHNSKTEDGDEISNSDAKRMLASYIDYELKGSEKAKKWAKASIDLCNSLTHDFNATKRNTALSVLSVRALASMIKELENTK